MFPDCLMALYIVFTLWIIVGGILGLHVGKYRGE